MSALVRLDPFTATDAELGPVVDLLAAVEARGRNLPTRSTEAALAWWRVPRPREEEIALVLGDPADPDGVCMVSLDRTAENEHIGFLGVAVHPDRRRRGIGRALVDAGTEVVLASGRRTLLAESDPYEEAGSRAFAAAVGFEPSLVLRGSALDVGAVDREMVAAWSSALHADYEVLVFDEGVPDEHLDGWLQAGQSMNDAPTDDLDVNDEAPDPDRVRTYEAMTRAVGGGRIGALARHRTSGDPAGFSNVWWEPAVHRVVWQGGTGVSRDHRGKGLGRVLKARVLEHLAERFPEAEEIRTDNAHTNPWMIRINDDLGFRPYGDIVIYQRQA